MNKTVNINLGGLFFHIDEDAYQKLTRYFDAIKRSLSPDGKDEIMNDIESRIAELLAEKLKTEKQVVGIREVDEIITVMGEPEDYRIDEDATQQNSTYYTPGYETVRTRKFYRDGDKGMIAGVCAGVGHYFKIDPLWIRILFIISLFPLMGTTIFVYILLWILIPKAITTTEKLEMTGEPINISNIEKKVREEINSISDRFQSVDYDKLGNTARNGAERIGNTIGTVFSAIFKALAKVIGAIITIFSALILGGLIITFFGVLFSSSIVDNRLHHVANMVNYTDMPLWIIAMLGLFAIGIPFFFLFLLGLKILANNLRPVGSITKYTLLALWIIAIAISTYLGISQAAQVSYEGKTVKKEQLFIAAHDTLQIKFRHNDYYAKSADYYSDEFSVKQDSAGNDIIYSNDVHLYILKTDEAIPFMQVEKIADGNSSSKARSTAEKIKYSFAVQGNTLILDNYFVTDLKDKYRNQKVEIFIYLPQGMIFKPDASVKYYDDTDNNFFDLWFDGDNYVYQMDKDNVKCLNCPEKHEEENGNEQGQTQDVEEFSTANGNIKIEGKDGNVDIKISKDSIRIKTKNN
jgi:phage shock protein PspC (stress-responsive transcriptional regulator)